MQWSERPATTLAGVHSARFGDVLRRGTGSGRSGNHTPGDAWAVVVPGTHGLRVLDRPPRLADVAATVAAACGVDGDEVSGRVAAPATG